MPRALHCPSWKGCTGLISSSIYLSIPSYLIYLEASMVQTADINILSIVTKSINQSINRRRQAADVYEPT